MPRNCNCAGSACSCLITAGQGVSVTGTGNSSDPYVVGLAEGQGATDAGEVPAGGTLDTQYVTTDSFYRVEALGALFITPPTAFGVQIDYYIANPESALIDILGTVYWEDGVSPVMTSPQMWITLINVAPGTWIGRGHPVAFA